MPIKDRDIPPEHLRVDLHDALTVLSEYYKELDDLLRNRQWRTLMHKLSQVEFAAREAGFRVNSIVYPIAKELR